MKFVRLDIGEGKPDIQSVGGLQVSRTSHPQSRQSIQMEAARQEQKVWARFVAETSNADEFLRTYIIDDRKQQVYIRLNELCWTLWRLMGRK